MPIYEYICDQCEKQFEELVRSVGDQQVSCPKCGSKRVRRALSVFAARATESPSANPGGGCGRCGDPNGPCQY